MITVESTMQYFISRIAEKPSISHSTLCGDFKGDESGYRRRASALELLLAQGKVVRSKKPWKYQLKETQNVQSTT